jgi:hypothetical protein
MSVPGSGQMLVLRIGLAGCSLGTTPSNLERPARGQVSPELASRAHYSKCTVDTCMEMEVPIHSLPDETRDEVVEVTHD